MDTEIGRYGVSKVYTVSTKWTPNHGLDQAKDRRVFEGLTSGAGKALQAPS